MAKTFEDIKRLKAEYDQAVKEFGKEAMADAFKSVFAAHPTVVAFKWTQCTPYFNDGDTCIFSVHGEDPKIQFEGEEDLEEVPYRCTDEVKNAASNAIAEAICDVPEDIMLAVFGDHAQITATRDGFEVEQYDHD